MTNSNNKPKAISIIVELFIIFLLLPSISIADDGEKLTKVGIAVSLQGQQLDIMIPCWIDDIAVISPSIYLIHANEMATETGLGIGFRHNFPKGDAYPYVGVRIGAIILNPVGSKHITDYLGSVVAGGERLFGDNFSVGVEAQLNITKSDEHSFRFGNPDKTNINTATSIYATFYFR